MFLEKLIEQHRVQHVVAQRVDSAIRIAHYEIWINSSDILRDQTKLRRAAAVAPLAERYGLERQDGFAGFVHRFDFLLKFGRRTSRAELARGVDYDRKSVAVLRLNLESVADKAGVAHIRAWDADCNYVVGRHDVKAGCKAQRNITQTRHDVRECTITHSCVTSPPLGLFCSAWVLIAVLLLPSVLKNSALRAIAAFVLPWASRPIALTPVAVLSAVVHGIGDPGGAATLAHDRDRHRQCRLQMGAGLPALLQANRVLSIKRVLPKNTANRSTEFVLTTSTGFNVSASATST